ncbi:MAG: acetylornithine deacetylase [Sphingobacterium sp.]|jgi:acetylornithine deacetylase|uniref:M20 family metallo-hydrolase n=1 Tax=unclassified Sphingobacterium TaxID=2609468 RepID=UPI0009850968|nr:M20 family metallo-hydrolase [Sphingobacterium sp. CZ-UAM]MDF2519095.1 acetylornithine deacetylase [Sphingobacterium sp.]OOG16448.1 acetylornithine deacetylase [Sphingobacterium sp. CZ-UAM]
MKDKDSLFKDSLVLLKKLIALSSLSREEIRTADQIEEFFKERLVKTFRKGNNVWVYNKHYAVDKPTILLNSHHDTVKANPGYTRDPLAPTEEEGKLYGLGSNDAGGCLVSLIATFLHFYERADLNYNFCLVASAEEEISGRNGIESVLEDIGPIDFAIVGEPTLMDLAIAEKGLMVLDCNAIGIAGHAARDEGDNAIYRAISDIQWFKDYAFEKTSATLGPIKMSVTMIQSGSQHNVVPASCNFVVDVRTTDAYTNEETLAIIKSHVSSEVSARSTRLKSSSIPEEHPIVQAGIALGRKLYGSPTMSDQALIPVPSLKLGPGDSARSHMADEFIYIDEIREGIDLYIAMLQKIV